MPLCLCDVDVISNYIQSPMSNQIYDVVIVGEHIVDTWFNLLLFPKEIATEVNRY